MSTMMKSIMDLRHYLRAPFAEDNGTLALLQKYKEWEEALARLLEQNDQLRRDVDAAERQRDKLARAAFTFEVMEDGSMAIETQSYKYVNDLNLSADTEIAVRNAVRVECLRRIGESAVRTEKDLREREARGKESAK